MTTHGRGTGCVNRKAIAAYERRITVSASRFDRYVDAELGGKSRTPASALSSDEEAGLKLFVGRGNCVNCHSGPLLTDNHFHNNANNRQNNNPKGKEGDQFKRGIGKRKNGFARPSFPAMSSNFALARMRFK